ncbi:patatin-like phospholipase family protein [Bosea sp. 117]|uniref:patatin-like phospholipase family protein n=1 Tax=Bosea sp. 117 TaxID=1125973 RepID=UPI000ACCB33F|nr:patatin-like phospholipase family protein [Bosea sp. 117]
MAESEKPKRAGRPATRAAATSAPAEVAPVASTAAKAAPVPVTPAAKAKAATPAEAAPSMPAPVRAANAPTKAPAAAKKPSAPKAVPVLATPKTTAAGSAAVMAKASAPEAPAATPPAKTSPAKAPAKKAPVRKPAAAASAAPKVVAAKAADTKVAEAKPAVETVASALAVHGPAGAEAVKQDAAPKAAKPARGNRKLINLGLQGGGAHGAFTWGVLDRLLEDGRIEIEGISGTSAGAMNAAVLASGLARGGNEGGREALNNYWRAVSKDGRTSPLQRTLLDRLMGNWSLNANPAYVALDVMSRFFSPYDLNPLNINPLMDLIAEHVDFDAVQSCSHVHVFVSATNVHTGKVRVFSKKELTPDAIMASACLPFMFQAVEIDGVPYWDGGYMGNPALFPFYDAVRTDDIVLVQINPIIRRDTPKTARDINNRMNEITFNASLLAQLRAAEFVGRLLKQGKLELKGDGVDGYRNLRIHRIDGAEKLIALDASTKMNAEWEFLVHLREIGREAADRFLEHHFDDIGVRSTLDVKDELTKN